METNNEFKISNEEIAKELSMKNLASTREKLNSITEREFCQDPSSSRINFNNTETNLRYESQKINQNSPNIQSVFDNQKILNTLRSIGAENAGNYNNLSFEEIHNLPSLFIDIGEALKKSNANVLELKETINELIMKEEKLKNKIKNLFEEKKSNENEINNLKSQNLDLKQENEKYKISLSNLNGNMMLNLNNIQKLNEDLQVKFKRENDQYEKRIEKLENEIQSKNKYFEDQNEKNENLKQQINELLQKNKKYKAAQGLLKDEISTIEEKLDDIKTFKSQVKELQNETTNLRNKIKELEEERRLSSNKENTLKEEIRALITNNKKIKSELKSELNEKINILKELENLKNNQKIFYDKHESLKNIIENTASERETIESKLKSLAIKNETLQKDLNTVQQQSELKYENIFKQYQLLLEEKEILSDQLNEKKFSEDQVYKISDKYEEEIFLLKCEMNIWKRSFLDIANYKLTNFQEDNWEEVINLDKNYIYNCPSQLADKAAGIVTYFKSLIEEEQYKTINLKSLKNALVEEQEKSSYLKQRLVQETSLRRKIHNRYMSIRGNLRVMCRVRPFTQNEKEALLKKSFLDSFSFTTDTVTVADKKTYDLDYVFTQKSPQSDVYEEVSLLTQSMLQGNNICVIAYGQTCTGKTYTILGEELESSYGIAVRTAYELFELLSKEPLHKKANSSSNSSCKLSLSIIEIYNEGIFNLLDSSQSVLNIFENSSGNLVIPDLQPIKINSFKEAVKLFNLAGKFRHTNSTSYNDRSSRSHCIYTFSLKIDKGDKVVRSKMHIIDLAGSERITKSSYLKDGGNSIHKENLNNEELIKKEAISINLSLHALSNVLNALSLKQIHVPYRDSKLTHYLKESLNENFNILLLLHVSPNIKDLQESISTLEFGARIVKICKHKTGKEKMILGGVAKNKNEEDKEI